MIVSKPTAPKKLVRGRPVRMDVLERENAIIEAIARRDEEWSVAIREVGGKVRP